MTARQIIKRLQDEGWYEVRQEGSHRHFAHDDRPGIVTVPVHGSKDIPKGTLGNIRRQAGWSSRQQTPVDTEETQEEQQ